jgi:hypothetical protein
MRLAFLIPATHYYATKSLPHLYNFETSQYLSQADFPQSFKVLILSPSNNNYETSGNFSIPSSLAAV